MARWLRQSTAVDLPIGPFVDSTDGVTPETALTLTQPDIRLKKNGAAWAQKSAAQTLAHEENGNYEVSLSATDTDTLGLLRLHVNETGALPVWEDFLVVPANVYDALVAGSDALQVHANEITAGLITAAAIATGAIDADALAADAVAEIADGVWDEAQAGHVTAGSFGEIATETAAILADTGTDGVKVDMAQVTPATPTTGTAGDALAKASAGIPQSAPGGSGGLATFDNVFAFSDPGTVNDVAAAVGDFDGDSGLSSTNDFYNGAFLVFTSGTLKGIARKISDYVGASRNLAFSGAAGTADAPFPAAPANGDSFVILGRHGG